MSIIPVSSFNSPYSIPEYPNSYYQDSPSIEGNISNLFEFNREHSSPESLGDRQFAFIRTQEVGSPGSSMNVEEGDAPVKVKIEPGMESTPGMENRKELLSIKTVKERIKLINPDFDPSMEIGIENCLACVISYYNWRLSGSEFPEKIDPYAKPNHEHMVPVSRTYSVLEDPFTDKLDNPREIYNLEGNEKPKGYICMEEDLPFTFASVPLIDLKKRVESNKVAWQQLEKDGETFKVGILFLNHNRDESIGHFLNFEYRRAVNNEGKKTKSGSYTLFITDPQSSQVLTFDQFLKGYKKNYASDIKIWSGQSQVNYNCNKTVKEMFETIKKEKLENPKQPKETARSVDRIAKKKTLKPKRNNEQKESEISKKHERDYENLESEITKKPKRNNHSELTIASRSPDDINTDNHWGDKEIKEKDSNFHEFEVFKDPSPSADSPGHAYYETGNKFLYGNGVPQDFKVAFVYLKLAALKGHAKAQCNLGTLYRIGKGVTQDFKLAFEYFQLAAEQRLALAQGNLGEMYRLGEGVLQDFKLAFEYFKLAAEQGIALAQFNLEEMYLNGEVDPQDFKLAFEYFHLAAKHGDAQTQCIIGDMYLKGKVVPQDFKLAFEYFKLAAKQGFALAQCNLGEMYLNGTGVPLDFMLAFEYYMAAAKQGDAEAQYNVGDTYSYGIIVQRDLDTASNYYSLAAMQGHTKAMDALRYLERVRKNI